MKSRTYKLVIDVLPILLIGAAVYYFSPEKFGPATTIRPLYDTLYVLDTLAITRRGDTVFSYMIDTTDYK